MSHSLSGRRMPGKKISIPLLNELTSAFDDPTVAEIVLTDDQKYRLESLLATSHILDSITGIMINSAHEIVSSRTVRVLRGAPGAGLQWRFEAKA